MLMVWSKLAADYRKERMMESTRTHRLLGAAVLTLSLTLAGVGPDTPTAVQASPVDGAFLRGGHGGSYAVPNGDRGWTVRRRVSAQPTGNPRLDQICKQMEDVINDGYEASDEEIAAGDLEGGLQSWGDSDEMVNRANQRGSCKFTVRD
jgi:hypothetical protein